MRNPVAGLWNATVSYALSRRRIMSAMIGGMYGYQSVAQRNLGLFRQYYANNEIVFAATTETVSASAVIPFVTERLVQGRWQSQPPNDPVQERLDNPNDDEDAILFRERGDTELIVTGNAIVGELEPRRGERIGELRVLPTKHVWIKRDERTGVIVQYLYDPNKSHGGVNPTLLNQPSKDAIPFPRERIIHRIYAPDPEVPDWGMGPVAAALDSIEADINITLYIKEFFRLGAVPAYMLITEARLSVEQEKQAQQRWASNVGGVTNAWKLGILSGQKGELQRLGLAPGSREIGLQDLRKSTEVRILSAMNVPPVVIGAAMGLEEATYSNYDQARQAMHEENTDPLIKKRDSTYTHYIRRRTGTKAVRVRGDLTDVLAVQRRVNERSERATRELQSGMTMRGEARALAGYPPSSNDSAFLVPLNLVVETGSVVTETRVQRLALILSDHKLSAQVIREQADQSGSSLRLPRVPEGVVRYVMTEVAPRGDAESKTQFARRVLMQTHALVVRYAQESAAPDPVLQ